MDFKRVELTKKACDGGLRGGRDRGVDLLLPAVRTQRDKEAADTTLSDAGVPFTNTNTTEGPLNLSTLTDAQRTQTASKHPVSRDQTCF